MEHDTDTEDAAFESGFANTEVETPAPAVGATEAPAPDQPPQGAQPAAAPAEPSTTESVVEDPFAGLPVPVRDLLARIPALEQRATAAEQIARTAQGRVASLQSQLERRHAEPQPAPPAPPRFPKLDALRQELPEVADALDEVVSATAQKQPTPQQPEPTPRHEPSQALQSDPQTEVLDQMRPTWAQEMVSSGFQLWLSTQPPDYQRAMSLTDKAVDVIGALGKYDAYVRQTQSARQVDATRQVRIASAVTPEGGARRPAARAPAPEDDEDAAFVAGFKG